MKIIIYQVKNFSAFYSVVLKNFHETEWVDMEKGIWQNIIDYVGKARGGKIAEKSFQNDISNLDDSIMEEVPLGKYTIFEIFFESNKKKKSRNYHIEYFNKILTRIHFFFKLLFALLTALLFFFSFSNSIRIVTFYVIPKTL